MGPSFRWDDGEYAALLPIAPLLDLLDHAARRWFPAELPRALGADTAVRGHGVLGSALAPFGNRLLHRHRRWRAGKAQHAVDGNAELAHRVLAILDEIERARRGLFDRKRI